MLGTIETRLSRLSGVTHAILRVGAALLFMQHGFMKLGMLGGIDGNGGSVQLMGQMGLAAGIETIGATLILIGFLTRPIALLAFFEMLAAVWIAHLPQGGWPIQNGAETPLLFALIWLFLVGNGAGPFSVDAMLKRRRGDSSLLSSR